MHDGRSRLDAEKLLAEARWATRLARKLVRDDAAAQDIVQSALVAALEAAPAEEGRVRPWLARVVRNFAAQSRRSDAHRTAREQTSARIERSPSAAETAERLESQRLLVEALEALEEPYRTTVTLRYLEGLSAAQIARRERIPAGTVRWRLKEGLDRLCARLDGRFGGAQKGTWALALLPILKRPPLGGILAGGAAGVLQGALVMNTVLKLGLAAALVLAASVGVYLSVDRAAPAAPPLAADAKPPTIGLSDGARAEANRLATAATSSVRASLPLDPKPAIQVTTSATTASRLLARCVDPTGAPLAGVRLDVRSFSPPAAAVSASDGRLSLGLELRDASEELWIAVSLASRATRFDRIVLDRGKTTDLGDLALEPGGAVAGLVVGPAGDPIAGAEVFVTKPEFEDRLEALRRRGPRHDGLGDPPVLSTKTDASGAFVIDGVPARSVRVWAGARGMRFTCTDPIDVVAGATRSDLRLALESLATEDVLEGVVLDPDGAPVSSAFVGAYWSGGFSSGAYTANTDEKGRFQVRLREQVPHDLRAVDPMNRWPEAILTGARPGARGLELRFAPGKEFELRVRSRDGAPVTGFGVEIRPTDGQHVTSYDGRDREGGTARIPTPPWSFSVDVLAAGYARRHLGPFESASVPAVVECELDPLPGVRGRVVAAGRPVGGAKVEVHALANPGSKIVSDGFPSRLEPRVTDSAETDEQGRFDFTVREGGTYAIVAEAEGLATTELSPVEIDPARGVVGLEIGMTSGGSIEGRVLLAGGRDPAGTIVGASRGDGYPRTVRAAADGSFRFDRLMPGRWNVMRAEREVRTRGEFSMLSIAKEPEEPTWNCTVAEGRATHFDLDLRNEQACVVAARVAFGDRPVQGWTLSIETSGQLETTGAGLDEHGRARVEVEQPGSYILALRTAGEGFDARFNRRTELARGETAWNLEIPVGGLEGRVAGATDGNLARLLYQAQLPDGVTFDAWITADESGHYSLPFVPAGKGSIFRITDDDGPGRRVASSRPIEIQAGRTLTVDVD